MPRNGADAPGSSLRPWRRMDRSGRGLGRRGWRCQGRSESARVRRPPCDRRARPRAGHNARMDSHEPDYIVVGERVALGPLRRDLAASYARWMNQPEVRRGLDQMSIATPQSQEKWVDENIERAQDASHRPSSSRSMTAPTPPRSAPPACSGSPMPTPPPSSASRRRAPRPGPGHRGHAARARLRVPRAPAAQRAARGARVERRGLTAYERAGFRRVGVRRGARMSRGRPTDLVIMDAVPEDFGASVLR